MNSQAHAKYGTVLLLVHLNVVAGFAQQLASEIFDEVDRLEILCRDYGDSIAVRWAPSTWALWRSAMTHGTTLTRTEYLTNGDSIVSLEQLVFPEKTAWQERLSPIEGSKAIYHILYEEIDVDNIPTGILGSYRQNELEAMRLGFLLFSADLHFPLAQALTLGYLDRKGSGSHVVKYSVIINQTDHRASVTNSYKSRLAATPIDQIYTLPEDRTVTLRWDNYYNTSGYIAFHVEHSLDSITWQQINEVPIAIAEQGDIRHREWVTFADTVETNFVDQYYRIKGINSFGEAGPYSAVIKTQARPPLKINSPFIYRAPNRGDTSIQVYWQLAGSDSQQVVQQIIYRAPHPDTIFKVLDTLDGTSRSFLDTSAEYENYYYVQAMDTYGRVYTGSIGHGQLPDKVPPHIPQGLQAVCDSLGNIIITWKPNRDQDLIGYRVFYQRYLQDDPIQLTVAVTPDTSFHHKLELDLLHDHAFYAIRAEDQVGNRSALSKGVRVQLPDTIRPSKPTIITIYSDFNGCRIGIAPSGSNDVQNHLLYRQISGNAQWELLDTLPAIAQTYLDSTLKEGETATYQLVAKDSSSNISKSNVALGRRIDNKIRVAPKQATVRWSKKEKQLIFSWSYSIRNDVRSIQLYQSRNSGNGFFTFKLLQTSALEVDSSDENSRFYTYRIPMDKSPVETLRYRLKINFRDGAESKMAIFQRI